MLITLKQTLNSWRYFHKVGLGGKGSGVEGETQLMSEIEGKPGWGFKFGVESQ